MKIPYISTPDKPLVSSTQKHLPIADITDNITIYKDGGAALVMESTSLNFGLLSEKEQQAVIAAYAALLNSLTFPIQIVIRSKRKDIGRYINSLEEASKKITNPKLSRLMASYKSFVSETIKKRNVLEKKFYIVIPFSQLELGVTKSFLASTKRRGPLPFSKDYVIKKAKVSLYPKRDHLMRQAGRLGLKLRQLSTNQLVELFYQIYNPEPPSPIKTSGGEVVKNGEIKKAHEILEKTVTKPEIPSPTLAFTQRKLSLLDILAPQSIEVDFDYLKINNTYLRTLYAAGYPRFVSAGWLEQIINFNYSLDISFYIYPIEGKGVLDDLRRKVAEMEAEISTDLQRGKIVNPSTQAKLEDAKVLQEQLVKGSERFFEFAFYISVPASSLEDLNQISKQVESTLGSLLVSGKHATLDMIDGFLSTAPFGIDRLAVTRNMDTTSLATTFPFTSAELSGDSGVLYGINSDNESFIIFDRFSLENGNMTIFATSGAGKSYFVKLELLRSLMLGTEVIVIDPESEYKSLAEAVDGEFISFSFTSASKINPFDLAQVYEAGENQLNLKLLSLHSLFKVIMGELNARQEALLDQALVNTYRAKGITQDPSTQRREPPLMEDLYKILIGMETPTALDLAARIEKFVKGSFVGIFDQHTNIDIKNQFTVFSVKELEEALRPVAMFVILDFIWTRVKRELKKRILVVDEAWHMMRYPDSAQFLWSVVKRSRKYFLGLTTITQDVEDFLAQDIGKAVVTNSALQLLLKQSPAAIDKVGELFYLSEGEKQLLLGANIGEGIFFAGAHHAPISIVGSSEEHQLITTKPQELIAKQMAQTQPPPRQRQRTVRPSTPGEAAQLAKATNPALRRQAQNAK